MANNTFKTYQEFVQYVHREDINDEEKKQAWDIVPLEWAGRYLREYPYEMKVAE
jgi:hypothetical protein